MDAPVPSSASGGQSAQPPWIFILSQRSSITKLSESLSIGLTSGVISHPSRRRALADPHEIRRAHPFAKCLSHIGRGETGISAGGDKRLLQWKIKVTSPG